MKAIDKLWAIVRNRLFCDDFVRQVILQGGYVTNEVRKKSVQIGEATTEAIELLVENPHDLYLCLTIIDGDSLDLANLSKLPLSTEWYADAEGERIIHTSPFASQKSSLEKMLYHHRVEPVTNYLVCFTDSDLLIPEGRERIAMGVPFIEDPKEALRVPCPTVFIRHRVLQAKDLGRTDYCRIS